MEDFQQIYLHGHPNSFDLNANISSFLRPIIKIVVENRISVGWKYGPDVVGNEKKLDVSMLKKHSME